MPRTLSDHPAAIKNRAYRARRKANGGPLGPPKNNGCANCGASLGPSLLYCGEPCRDAKLAEFDALYPWIHDGRS